MTYRPTRYARQELLEIWAYIAGDNESAADRFIDLLIHHSRCLAEIHTRAENRDDLRKGHRSCPVGQYVIFYRVQSPGVQIMHIIHGKRDIDYLMRG